MSKKRDAVVIGGVNGVTKVSVESPQKRGPSWLVTMPEDATEEELTSMTKAIMEAFPESVVGHLLVVPAYVKVKKL